MTAIDWIRSVGAMGLVVATGARFEPGAWGQAASAPRIGAILGGAALRSIPVVSAGRGDLRPTRSPASHVVDAASAPLGGPGIVGGVPGREAAGEESAGRAGPSLDDRTGVPMIFLAQAKSSVAPAPVVPGVGVGPVVPGIGVGTVMPTPPPPRGYSRPYNVTVEGSSFGFGFGGAAMYSGFYAPYGGYGISLPPTPEYGTGAYRAGNSFDNPAAGTGPGAGVPADPNARRARNPRRNSLGGAADDPFDAAAAGNPPPNPQVRSRRSHRGRRPSVRRPAPDPSTRKPESGALPADPRQPVARKTRDEEPAAPQAKPAATAKAEEAKPAARPRSMLGSPR